VRRAPRRRPLLAVAVAAAAAVVLAPSGAGLTRRPLAFSLIARGTAPADELDRRSIDVAGFVHSNFPFAEGMVQTFGMGESTRAAVDRMDFNTQRAAGHTGVPARA
jgi:hypothetical protein